MNVYGTDKSDTLDLTCNGYFAYDSAALCQIKCDDTNACYNGIIYGGDYYSYDY